MVFFLRLCDGIFFFFRGCFCWLDFAFEINDPPAFNVPSDNGFFFPIFMRFVCLSTCLPVSLLSEICSLSLSHFSNPSTLSVSLSL